MTTAGMGGMSRGSGNTFGGRLPAVGARVISADGHELSAQSVKSRPIVFRLMFR